MPFLHEVGLQTFWNNCKAKFGNKLTMARNELAVTINLHTSDNNNLSSVSIPPANHDEAGVMLAIDKKKLDGVAEGATANIGTITQVKAVAPIVGGGTSGSVTVSHGNVGSPGTYGTTATTQLAPSFGSSFVVPGFVTDVNGHVSSAGKHNVVIPKTEATASVAGLMSASDKSKLNGIAANATASSPATNPPGNIALSSSAGSSTLYARQDHTHGIALATGDSNGQVKIAGQNISVKGLADAAYKSTVTSLSSSSSDSAIPTAKAVYSYTESKFDSLAITRETIDLICVANTVH